MVRRNQISRFVIPVHDNIEMAYLIAAAIVGPSHPTVNRIDILSDNQSFMHALSDPASAVLDLPRNFPNRDDRSPGKGSWAGSNDLYGPVGRAWSRYGERFCALIPHNTPFTQSVTNAKKLAGDALPFIKYLDLSMDPVSHHRRTVSRAGLHWEAGIVAVTLEEMNQVLYREPLIERHSAHAFWNGVRLVESQLRLALRPLAEAVCGDVD